MDFTRQLELLRAAAGDPLATALATHDILLADSPEPFRRAVEAAAIPHWFDREILATILGLDSDAVPFEEISSLPFIETFPARQAYNVHESTRLALRRRLFAEKPDRFRELSRRAADAFSGAEPRLQIERAFHVFGAGEDGDGTQLRQLNRDLHHSPELPLVLCDVLDEFANGASWPPNLRAWSMWIAAEERSPYRPLPESLELAARARQLFGEAGNLPGIANAALSEGKSLQRRGLPGDAETALSRYQESLDIRRKLRQSKKNSAGSARDLSVSLNIIGDYLLSRGQPGDAETALAHYQESQVLLGKLHQANPNSFHAARDFSISLDRLGRFLHRRGQAGDTEAALALYRESFAIRTKLHQANPSSAENARDLSVSLQKLGDFLSHRGQPGDADEALARYQESFAIVERLHQANPNSAEMARDLSISLNRLGNFLSGRGQPGDEERALARCQESLAIAERLHRANPNSAEAARDLSVSHYGIFRVYRDLGREKEAMAYLTKCFDILNSFHQEGRPMDPQMRGLHAELSPMFTQE